MLIFIIYYHVLQRQICSKINNFQSLSDQWKVKFVLLMEEYQNNNEKEKRVFKSCMICQEQLKYKGKNTLKIWTVNLESI